MEVNIFTLTSALHNADVIESQSALFLKMIAEHTDVSLNLKGDNFSQYGKADADLIFVRTGGTESLFLENFEHVCHGKIYLLTSGENNSLAASMEILSYINSRGLTGEILHGTPSYIGKRINDIACLSKARKQLSGSTIGVVGQPSDWLISSSVDAEAIRKKLGAALRFIEMDEFLQIYDKTTSVPDLPFKLAECKSEYFQGALKIYAVLKVLIKKYHLSALTLRCFDLLSTIKNTGCLALSLLNSDGIPSSCEGDIPALLTMMIGNALFSQSGFQANPSRIDPESGQVLFAHCTVPISMVKSFVYDTHFESGIGVALHGELPCGEATICKVSGDLSRLMVEDVELLNNQYEKNLCRTQVQLLAPAAINYFLTNPIANHHIIFTGHHASLIKQFFASLG